MAEPQRIMSEATFRSHSATDGPPGYRERSGEPVAVIARVDTEVDPDAEDEALAPIYRIRFQDGVEAEAFADELEPEPR